jgi:hypothetical protein
MRIISLNFDHSLKREKEKLFQQKKGIFKKKKNNITDKTRTLIKPDIIKLLILSVGIHFYGVGTVLPKVS